MERALPPLMTDTCVLVTGAASGIGRATAIAYAEAGARKVACLDIHHDGAAETVQMVEQLGAEAKAIHVDLGDVGTIKSAFAQAMEMLGELDAAAHIGGYSWRGATRNVTPTQWDAVVDVNLKGTFFCCQEALGVMNAQGYGAIVNMSADAVFYPIHGFSVQAAAKGGIVFMTETMALEAARRGIRVNAVSPGCVTVQKTGAEWHPWPEMDEEDLGPNPPRSLDKVCDQIAAGRFMEPREIANTIVFLSSPYASGISGQTLKVNGGGYLTLQIPKRQSSSPENAADNSWLDSYQTWPWVDLSC